MSTAENEKPVPSAATLAALYSVQCRTATEQTGLSSGAGQNIQENNCQETFDKNCDL